MAKGQSRTSKANTQSYPRVTDEDDKFHGFLSDTQLVPHESRVSVDELKAVIREAIRKASLKSSRELTSGGKSVNEIGWELFKYFHEYPGDPASAAHQLRDQHGQDIAAEMFRNKTLQMERMNSGWRYQFLAVDCAENSGRFAHVSDIGAKEADFVAKIGFLAQDGNIKDYVNLYVSVKKRWSPLTV